jgi:6,7-dimethyl-8-ribityllumazine synthase
MNIENNKDIPQLPDAKVTVVVSEYNREVSDGLLAGVERALKDAGVTTPGNIVWAVGSWEVAQLTMFEAKKGECDAIVALGSIIKGETSHDHHLATAVTNGLLQVAFETGVPVGLGVITANTLEQAQERASEKVNRGYDATLAVLKTLSQSK